MLVEREVPEINQVVLLLPIPQKKRGKFSKNEVHSNNGPLAARRRHRHLSTANCFFGHKMGILRRELRVVDSLVRGELGFHFEARKLEEMQLR